MQAFTTLWVLLSGELTDFVTGIKVANLVKSGYAYWKHTLAMGGQSQEIGYGVIESWPDRLPMGSTS